MNNVVEVNVQKPASPLSVRNFRLLWIGEGISLLGDQFYMIALPWLVLQLTGSALALGTVMALAGIPRALFVLVGGAFVDRFSPRSVMIDCVEPRAPGAGCALVGAGADQHYPDRDAVCVRTSVWPRR